MQWWLPPSRELAQAEWEALLRRFVEASRRAEITALMNVARSSGQLAEIVSEELCEACEAEVAFVMGRRAAAAPPELIGSVGLTDDEPAAVLDDALCLSALDAEGRSVHLGDDLLALGARSVLIASAARMHGRQVVVGVARLWEQRFREAEMTLVEAVTPYVGHMIDRFWDREEVLRAQSQLISSLLPPGPVSVRWDAVIDR
jgi:hypothetical protein